MDWTALFNHHHHHHHRRFLRQSLSAADDDDQPVSSTSQPALSVFRPVTVDLDLSGSTTAASTHDHGDDSPVSAAGATAARRTVSISRSGRYKSKTKQRVRLFSNGGVDVDVGRASPPVALERPATVTSDVADRRRRLENVEQDACRTAPSQTQQQQQQQQPAAADDASATARRRDDDELHEAASDSGVHDGATANTTRPPLPLGAADVASRRPRDDSRRAPAHRTAAAPAASPCTGGGRREVCHGELSIAEHDESTDL